MIPRSDLVVWSDRVGWPSIDQVEQDLVLSRLIVEVAENQDTHLTLHFADSAAGR